MRPRELLPGTQPSSFDAGRVFTAVDPASDINAAAPFLGSIAHRAKFRKASEA